MNKKLIALAIGIAGQALIVVLFLLLLPIEWFYTKNIVWLDMVVVSIMFWMWILNIGLIPSVARSKFQGGFAGIGVRWTSTYMYTIAAFTFICLTVLFAVSDSPIQFKWQIMIQAIFLFVYIVALFWSFMASEKATQVYNDQQQKKAGKIDVRNSLRKVLAAAEDNGAPAEIIERLNMLVGETRFVTPSNSPEVIMADEKINEECLWLCSAMTDLKVNGEAISRRMEQLERNFRRRKEVN